jgi:hypothetical protein
VGHKEILLLFLQTVNPQLKSLVEFRRIGGGGGGAICGELLSKKVTTQCCYYKGEVVLGELPTAPERWVPELLGAQVA